MIARAALVLFAITASMALAQTLTTSTEPHGLPGSVLALPLHQDGPGTIEVTAPKGLTVLGVLQASGSELRSLATVLIGSNVLAGEYTLTARLVRNGSDVRSTSLKVRVDAHPDATIRASAPDVIEAGATKKVPVVVTNTGNMPDRYDLTATTSDDVSLSANHVALKPGASTTVELSIHPNGVGERTVYLDARSQADPSFHKGFLITYHVFALGTTDPNAPVLDYALPLQASYGSEGLSYRASLSVTGDLSSIVQTGNFATVAPEERTASVSFFGARWGVVYGYAQGAGHSLSVQFDNVNLTGELDPQHRVTTGVSYGLGNLLLSYQHRWGPQAQDTLYASRTFQVTDRIQLFPSLGVTGQVHDDGTYHVSPVLGGGLTWTGPVTVVSADASLVPLPSLSWNAFLSVSTRAAAPVSATATLNLAPGKYSVYANAVETPDNALSLSQVVGYRSGGTAEGHFGVTYAFPDRPVDVLSLVDLYYQDGALSGRGQIGLRRSQLPWIASVRVIMDPSVTVAYGQTYVTPDYTLGGSVALPLRPPFAPVLTLSAGYAASLYSLGASLAYSVGTAQLGGSTTLGVQVLPALSLNGTVGYQGDTGLTWRIGAAASVSGGIAVPSPIVNAFGGLDVGTIVGKATLGSGPSTRPLKGIVVELGDGVRSSKTDSHGDFRFTAPPGSYTLRFPGLPPTMVPPSDLKVTVQRHVTIRKDLRFKLSLGVTGQVYLDTTRSGHPTNDSVGVANVTVQLTSVDGTIRSTVTGGSGHFTFRDLKAGDYSVAINPLSLPANTEIGQGSESVTVTDSTTPFVSLGVQPVKRHVSDTLTKGDLALTASVSPSDVPPGALVTVTAHVPGARSVTASIGGGRPADLKPTNDKGDFSGDVEVPTSAGAVALVDVTATADKKHASQSLMVFVTPGPLGSVQLDPAFAEAGSTVTATAHLFIRASEVHIRVGDTIVQLEHTSDGTFTATFTAPTASGTLHVELYADGKKLSTATMLVKPASP